MKQLYRPYSDGVVEIDLVGADDATLERISKERVLGLSLSEMKLVQAHFKKEGRNPRDIELEAFAQSWSEHCCYKSSRPVLKRTVFGIEAPQNINVISEDAGVVDFDKDHAYVVGFESHNHPSALDPYGGSSTGVGGILRDVVCMGGQPIALTDPLFFGPLNIKDKEVPEGTKHPRYLFGGVVSGIADYGNRVGIPTVSGQVTFHKGYVTNCLVNAGCVGIIRKSNVIHSRVGAVGDIYIMAGGRTGRDGIHGVSFASAQLDEKSDEESRPAVQLGYANVKEPLIHACLEANERGLLTGMKDFGGGGLSCVSAEMAHSAKLGGVIDLDKVPLKEEGLSPWEIWVSESQERMMVTVKPENVEKVLEVFRFWDVEATVVGSVEKSNRIRAMHKGKEVLNLDLEFLIAGVSYNRPAVYLERDESDPTYKTPNLSEIAKKLLANPNIASKEGVIRRYDHEVRGSTIIKPMQGAINHSTHGDAAVLKPLKDSNRGLAIATSVNPYYCEINPYWGAASAVDEAVRNLVAVGAAPHSLADCLNFGNPEKTDRMADFIKACEGLRYAAVAYKVPYVSGNVSLYNEGTTGAIPPTPSILAVGIIEDVRKAVTSDLKKAGNILYLVGNTRKEMGGSQYYQELGLTGGQVPIVVPEETKQGMDGLLSAMKKSLVASCHDLSDGGLFVAACEMAFGGKLGVKINLDAAAENLPADVTLFSESNGRWLTEVPAGKTTEFEKTVKARRIGVVSESRIVFESQGKKVLDEDAEALYGIWSNALR
ncbi:Phosphoribosylformylglycinamidine synthase subunit PurL [uncultured archaeon]|nr:Phosphoribosylformylglycinamidine synthase subunit PurL [uncultured archaeon]